MFTYIICESLDKCKKLEENRWSRLCKVPFQGKQSGCYSIVLSFPLYGKKVYSSRMCSSV